MVSRKKRRSRKRNTKGRFVKRVKETVGTESNGGEEYNSFMDLNWGFEWY